MALFTKNPFETSTSAPLYTVGGQKTILIVGLGNPGKEYEGTRHNIGFRAVEAFVRAHQAFAPWTSKKDLKCMLSTATLGSARVIVIKPTTFMNLSGEAVQAVQHFYKITPGETVGVYDELDLEFGKIRLRGSGSSAGHNGIKSIIQHCGEDFGRIRIGINSDKRTKNDEKDFVLKAFSQEENGQLSNMDREVTALLTEYVYSGILPSETRSFVI